MSALFSSPLLSSQATGSVWVWADSLRVVQDATSIGIARLHMKTRRDGSLPMLKRRTSNLRFQHGTRVNDLRECVARNLMDYYRHVVSITVPKPEPVQPNLILTLISANSHLMLFSHIQLDLEPG
jgi:hypothetical protein